MDFFGNFYLFFVSLPVDKFQNTESENAGIRMQNTHHVLIRVCSTKELRIHEK